MSGYANELTIEQQAHNNGYERLDVKGCTADDLCCVAGADEILIAGIDMKTVCEDVNNSGSKAKAEISFDPGRYALARSFLLPIIIVADRISQQLFYLPYLHGRQVYFFIICSFFHFGCSWRDECHGFCSMLTLNAPIATKVVCFSCLLKCLRSLYGKQCGPRSDCS